MTWTVSRAGDVGRRAVMLGMSLAVVLSGTSAASADQSAEARTVKGVWHVEVTIRDCSQAPRWRHRSIRWSRSRRAARSTRV